MEGNAAGYVQGGVGFITSSPTLRPSYGSGNVNTNPHSTILFINMCSNSRSHSRLHLCRQFAAARSSDQAAAAVAPATHTSILKRLDALHKFKASSQQQIQKENAKAAGKQLFSATLIPNSAPGIIFCIHLPSRSLA
jgi:hypothetical protein